MMDLKSIKRVSAILFFSLITNFAAYAADPAPASAATDKNSARSNESPANQRMKMNDPKLQADLKEASSKTMVKPDFAFPRQVSDKAQALYDQALRERKPCRDAAQRCIGSDKRRQRGLGSRPLPRATAPLRRSILHDGSAARGSPALRHIYERHVAVRPA